MTEALEAQAGGADYLGVSPIFRTATKADAGAPAGVALLAEIRRRVTLPLVAIGGITLANAPSVIEAGADAVCAISAVVTHPDVEREIKKFQGLFGAAIPGKSDPALVWRYFGLGAAGHLRYIFLAGKINRQAGFLL